MPIYVKADKVKSDHTYTQFPITINDNTDSAVPEWSLFGNGQQTGTPSPQSIIMPTFCGVRTNNLFDATTSVPGIINNDGDVEYNFAYSTSEFIRLDAEFTISLISVYTASSRLIRCGYYTESKQHIANDDTTGFKDGHKAFSFTPPDGTAYIRFSFISRAGYEDSNVMLNSGSTALPYENFGYKIPITLRDFSCTILGVQQSTNYAYISKSVLPNASVGDYISTTIEGVDYSLAIMQIDDNYIYIENRTV